MNGGQEIFDSLLGNLANIKGAMTFWGKGIGVEGNERVLSAMLLEGIIKGEEAREVSCVCDKSCPYS